MYQPMICTDQDSHQEVTLYVQCIRIYFLFAVLVWVHTCVLPVFHICYNNMYTYVSMYVCTVNTYAHVYCMYVLYIQYYVHT